MLEKEVIYREWLEKMNAAINYLEAHMTEEIDYTTAFNRAFQAIHGVAPSIVKTQSVSLKAFSPIQFKMVVKGVESMNYRIEKKEAFRIIGVSQPLKSDVKENFQIVSKMWQEAMKNGIIPKLASRMNTSLQGLLGVSTCKEQDKWHYYIAVAEEKEMGDWFQDFLRTVPPNMQPVVLELMNF